MPTKNEATHTENLVATKQRVVQQRQEMWPSCKTKTLYFVTQTNQSRMTTLIHTGKLTAPELHVAT
jgi:hypothetical protein